jgi:hypothetical protein
MIVSGSSGKRGKIWFVMFDGEMSGEQPLGTNLALYEIRSEEELQDILIERQGFLANKKESAGIFSVHLLSWRPD